MATLTVWKYDTTDGAEEAVKNLEELVQQDLIVLEDAATVRWEVGKKKPKTQQLTSTKGLGAMSGTFWGMLFGLIFFVPLLGAAVGAAAGALSGSLTDVGIDDAFINKVRDQVTPGTSALFLMTSDAVIDKVREAMRGHEGELIFTNLSSEQEAALREVFAE
ncbi:DUF1269 domain-containing protein [Nocardioides albus]|uniref:Putative membrane protein n=1 Tax=Nocardioides albus TaxID=1841 RepID=A0A7W5FAD7_9ACTN|nr:DUF1269 domain-containing protein [Nocardioides albus]MBB3091090.1 putative membrane protein [Nocardioides albus]GGU34408.1 membrane protein [Nocardioides albus]